MCVATPTIGPSPFAGEGCAPLHALAAAAIDAASMNARGARQGDPLVRITVP